MTEGKGNNNSNNAYCHKPLGKFEVGNVGEVEVGRVEVVKAGKVEVGKVGKIQVGKIGTVQLGNLDKPTIFNKLEQHASTSEEELINSTTKSRIKLSPKRGLLFKLSPFYDPNNKVVRVG